MPKRFTADDIELLRSAVAEGLSGNEIAILLERSPLSIRVKACSLGLKLRTARGEHEIRFALPKHVHVELKRMAEERGSSPSRLVRLLTEVCIRDRLLKPLADRTVSLQAILTENCRERPAPKRVVIDKTVRVA
jgi:hypothetical protein